MSDGKGRVDADHVFSSVRWVAVGQGLSQGASVVVTLTLARLLTPEVFGLMTMAGVITALGYLFSTLGAGPAIVQKREVSDPLLKSLTTLGLGMGFALTVGLALLSRVVAAFYGEPRVAWVVAALGCTFALASFGIVPEALLQRELRFSRLVSIDLAVLGVSATCSIGLAWAGFGVWALVGANLASAAVRSALLVLSSPWRLSLGFDWQALRGEIGFGASVMAFNVTQYLSRNSDRVIIGRRLGAVDLGYYDYAYRFYMYPLDAITGVLLKVMFPTLSRMQGDVAQLGRTFLRANGAIALLTFPMMAGLAAVADPFVRVVLGETWAPIIPLVLVLAPVGLLQSIASTPGQLFLARGRSALRTWWSVIYAVVFVGAFLVGVHWGILGVAVAYGIVMVPILVIAFWLALRLVSLRLIDLWRVLRSTMLAAALMALLVFGLRLGLETAGMGQVLVLCLCVPTGVAAYIAALRWLQPEALADVHRMLPAKVRENAVLRSLLFRRVEPAA